LTHRKFTRSSPRPARAGCGWRAEGGSRILPPALPGAAALHFPTVKQRGTAMAQATLKNQQKILAGHRTIVSNQKRILRNQERLLLVLANEVIIIRNQEAIIKNQKKILANQAKLGAR
jgi:hypothetical protein